MNQVPSHRPSRRSFLGSGAVLGLGGLTAALAACTPPRSPSSGSSATIVEPSASPSRSASDPGRILLAYFSRAEENYYYGDRRDLEVGNTEVLARMIGGLIDCDVHRIEAAEPYPEAYDATVARNVIEQDRDHRPAIADPMDSLDGYDHMLLGSPIWNVRPPMIMSTFADGLDFTGTTVHPFATYAVSGLGSTERIYATACAGARMGPGLAVRGEEVDRSRPDVETWLRRARSLTS